jgi:hypothetical protein
MSWDIFIQDLPDVARVADIPADFRPRTLGSFEHAIERIHSVVPFVERQDDDWLFVRTPEIDLSMQLNREVGTTELRHISIHVHGGVGSPACVAAIVRALGFRALDTATNEFFNPEAPEHGLAAWLTYRQAIMNAS